MVVVTVMVVCGVSSGCASRLVACSSVTCESSWMMIPLIASRAARTSLSMSGRLVAGGVRVFGVVFGRGSTNSIVTVTALLVIVVPSCCWVLCAVMATRSRHGPTCLHDSMSRPFPMWRFEPCGYGRPGVVNVMLVLFMVGGWCAMC